MRSAELVHFPLLFSFDLGLPGSLRMPGRDSQISASQPHSYKARETTLGRKSITAALCLISIPKITTLGPGAATSELILRFLRSLHPRQGILAPFPPVAPQRHSLPQSTPCKASPAASQLLSLTKFHLDIQPWHFQHLPFHLLPPEGIKPISAFKATPTLSWHCCSKVKSPSSACEEISTGSTSATKNPWICVSSCLVKSQIFKGGVEDGP